MMGNVADTKARPDVVDLRPIPGTEHFSPIKKRLTRRLFALPPDRMAAALRMMELLIERQEAGMSQEERTRLMWQEAVDGGWVDRDAVPPEVQLAAAD